MSMFAIVVENTIDALKTQLAYTHSARFVFYPPRAYIRRLRTAVYRHLAKHTSGRKPTF
jgi:hypothetical protein